MPKSIQHDQDDLRPLNHIVKAMLNGDGQLVADIQKRSAALKPDGKMAVVSATIYGTSLIIRIYEAWDVAPWRDLGTPPDSTRDVFWFSLQDIIVNTDKDVRLVTINNPTQTSTKLGRLLQTCTMLDCHEFDNLDDSEPTRDFHNQWSHA